MNRVHGSLKRQDNEAKNGGLLKCTRSATFKEPGVGCDPQVAFKSPKEYASLAMQAPKDKQLTSHEFMQVTELSVFKGITDTFWTLLYERPDLYVYVSEEMVIWLGFEGEGANQKKHILRTLIARSIHYNCLYFEELQKATHRVLQEPTDKHLLMRPLDFRVSAASVHKPNEVKRWPKN